MNRCCSTNRRGVGLLEVIICTALVALMIVPIAGVIRASGQSIARADGSTSTEAELRRALRWLADTIRDGDLVAIQPNQIQIQLSSGNLATVRVRGGTLEMREGATQTILAENVRDILFTERIQTSPPNSRVGLTMALRARDSATGSWVTVDSNVSIAPQI